MGHAQYSMDGLVSHENYEYRKWNKKVILADTVFGFQNHILVDT